MRKIATVVMALMLMASICYADDTISKTVYSYPIKNTSGVRQVTVIPTTSIRPLVDKVIGYSILPYNGALAAECYIGIFDETTPSLAGEIFAENEAEQRFGSSVLWSFGKYINSGVSVSQGANTWAIVYFIRK